PGGLFPPQGSARRCRRSTARCSYGSSRMSCYGSSRATRLPSSVPDGSNEVVLGDRAKITNLMRRGARLAVEADKRPDFEKLGLQPAYTTEEALAQATVVIDCTSDGLGLTHKRDWYEKLPRAQGFIAQGSETGFGKMYARGINDEALVPGEDRFVQVVSCNTHNLAVLIATLALHDEAPDNLLEGRFVCMRRSSDISQEKSFIAAP